MRDTEPTDIHSDIGAMNIRARSLLWMSVFVRKLRRGHPQF